MKDEDCTRKDQYSKTLDATDLSFELLDLILSLLCSHKQLGKQRKNITDTQNDAIWYKPQRIIIIQPYNKK